MDIGRTFSWQVSTKLIVGPGSSRKVGEELRALGGTKALLSTDRGVREAGVLAGVLESLDTSHIRYTIYDGVEPNPSIRCVEEAAAKFRAEGCDCLLGVGGGSSMDTAKLVGAVTANPAVDIREMEGRGKIVNPIPPLVAIPTTCGTGSEVTISAVATDLERHYKMGIGSPMLFPRVALIDGALLTSLPGPIVASTGLDALCHATESYVNLVNNPISDALDLQAISMISRWLRPAVANANLEAVSNMLLAATMAGMGFANTRLTIVHAMSHPVSGYYGVPHGVANAVLLPLVMEFNLMGNSRRFADVARAMGEDTQGLRETEAARLAVKAVRGLSNDVGIPESFKPFGVTEEHLDAMIEDTFKSGNIPLNPVRVSREAVREIYLRAIRSHG